MGKEIIITWPDQSNAILSNFILTGLHAACMHAACIHVKIDYLRTEMILMNGLDAHIIRMFCNHHFTGLHAFFLHEVQNVCHLSRLCVLVVIPKSKWYVAFQTPTLCYFYFAKEEVQSDQKRSHCCWHSKTIRYFTIWLSLSIRYLLKVGGCSPAGPLYWWSWTQWVIENFQVSSTLFDLKSKRNKLQPNWMKFTHQNNYILVW